MKKVVKNLLLLSLLCTLTTSAWARQHAVIWTSGVIQDLGSLGGDSLANGINDSGAVVGRSLLADGVTTHAFLWTSATGMVDLGPVPGGNNSEAAAINNLGQVVGAGIDGNGIRVPFSWTQSGGFVTLPENAGSNALNYAFAVNDAGSVTGQRYLGQVVSAFLWRPTTGFYSTISPLPAQNHTVGNDINNAGHLTGTASNKRVWDAMFWSKQSGTRDIGRPAGQTYAAGVSLNDQDEVVGFGGTIFQTPFYWSRATGMIIMQTLDGGTALASDINNSGTIAGYGTTAGTVRGFFWADKNSVPQVLSVLPGGTASYGLALNASGTVAGYADLP